MPAAGAARPPALLKAAGAVLLCGLLAGTAGALLAAVVCLVALLVARARDSTADNLALLLALPSGVAVAAYAVRPWGDSAGWAGTLSWPHYSMVVVLAFVLVSASERDVKR